MIYDFKREKDLRELQKTNDYPERPHLDAILDVRAKAEQLMREFVGEPDVPAEPGCWLVVGPLCEDEDSGETMPIEPKPILSWSVETGSVFVTVADDCGPILMDTGNALRCRDGIYRFVDGEVATEESAMIASLKRRWEDEHEAEDAEDTLFALMAQEFSFREVTSAVVEALLEVFEINGVGRLAAIAEIEQALDLRRKLTRQGAKP